MTAIPDRCMGDVESRTFDLNIPGPENNVRLLVVTVGFQGARPYELFVNRCPDDQRASANACARLISKWMQADGEIGDIISQLEGQSDPWPAVPHSRLVNNTRPFIKSTPDALAWVLKEVTGHPR